MTINIKISLCKITRASKLFQRNYYLPLMRPMSPKDAARRKEITGKNVLGSKFEHYIPVFKTQEDKTKETKARTKGAPIIKKRVKKKDGEKYVAPFFDDNMENHLFLQSVLDRKCKDNGQFYLYEIPDKNYTLCLSNQIEKAIKDKDIVDLTIAQRSEKIVLLLNNGKRVAMPLAKFIDEGALYRGSGWTKPIVEEEHHHGKETMGMAKLFEAKEAGIEDWELEMMRMASKRKRKVKGEDKKDWNVVMSAAADNMDWDQFEEDTKQILDESGEMVEEENIPMSVNDMDKTRNVNEKLKAGGEDILAQLPTMSEIPEVIKILETGELCDVENVSGVVVVMADAKICFVPGQIVKTDDNEVFVPGQTIDTENGMSEYTPGITVLMEDGEPELIPGLVFGEEEQSATFLPGESTITEEGQLQFEATDEDRPPKEETPPPPPTPPLVEIKMIDMVIERESSPPVESFRPQRQPLEDCLVLYEERRRRAEELEKKRMKDRTEEKMLKAESEVDKIRYAIRMKMKNFKIEQTPVYYPLEPVLKSSRLVALEKSIDDGSFEDDRTRMILERVRNTSKTLRVQTLTTTHGVDGEFGTGAFTPPLNS